jgi:SAM-dependent methyltransferase
MSPNADPGPFSVGASADVQAFYERYPYPGPVETLDAYRQLWANPQRRRADHHLFQPATPYREDPSILVAGCGTSQAAKHALRWPAARVTGIDFSATSVRCTEELKRKHRLDNLDLHQLPIERAGELGMQFDQIVCTGVLHHLADPDAGLRALRSLLKPDGAMHLMVYAPYGRAGIYMLQEFCRRIDVPATEEGIADLMAALKVLPPGHPMEHLLRQAPDFKHAAAVADALLNPQDRAYSVPQLFEFLSQGGLRFGRWLQQAPYSPHCGVMATLPQAGRIAALVQADQFAAVELFRGTMATHSIVAYRDDRPGGTPQPDFSGDAWRHYVPIRQPDTVCVQERLPPGAAAVLINRTHPYRDLVMAIDEAEKRLLDAVDGSRSIASIIAIVREQCALRSSPALPDMARSFFERLWWWDQVVFDTSGPAGPRQAASVLDQHAPKGMR